MARLLGSTGQASKTGVVPDDSLQGSIFAILCKNAEAGSYQLGELSALLAAWQVTEAWLPGDVGHSQRLRSTQACGLLACLFLLWLSAADCCTRLLSAWSMHSMSLPVEQDMQSSRTIHDCEDVPVLQLWLGSKAPDYPSLRHLQQTYGLLSTEVQPIQQDSKSKPNAEMKPQVIPDNDQDRGVDEDALKRIRGCFQHYFTLHAARHT